MFQISVFIDKMELNSNSLAPNNEWESNSYPHISIDKRESNFYLHVSVDERKLNSDHLHPIMRGSSTIIILNPVMRGT
jgi:hypothetical protein